MTKNGSDIEAISPEIKPIGGRHSEINQAEFEKAGARMEGEFWKRMDEPALLLYAFVLQVEGP